MSNPKSALKVINHWFFNNNLFLGTWKGSKGNVLEIHLCDDQPGRKCRFISAYNLSYDGHTGKWRLILKYYPSYDNNVNMIGAFILKVLKCTKKNIEKWN